MSSPNKSRWSRMGTVVRRASSLVAPRSSSSDRDDAASTKSSIKGINTTPAATSPPAPGPQGMVPSPIAESPAREAASSEDPAPASDPAPAPVLSPLAQAPVVASPTELPPSSPTSDEQQTEAELASPQGYVPPPLLDSSAVGPGAFTDEPDELPQPQVIRDPSLRQRESTDEHAPQAAVAEAPVEEAVVDRAFERAAEPEQPVAAVISESPVERAVTEPTVEVPVAQEVVPTQPATPVSPVGEAASYFNLPVQNEEPVDIPRVAQEPTETFQVAVESNASGGSEEAPQEQSRGLGQTDVFVPPRMLSTPPPEQSAPAAPVYPMPVYNVHEVWGGFPHKDSEEPRSTIPSMNGNASARSRASSIRIPEDPFADPIAPRIAVSHHPELPNPYDSHHDRDVPHERTPAAVVMPLPTFNEVIPSRSLHEFPSTESAHANGPNMETDETRPLLSGHGTPRNNYLLPNAPDGSAANVNVSFQSGVPTSSVWPTQSSGGGPRLHDLGWIEYQLPDGAVYYVHPTRRITTDVDLRIDSVLDIVTEYINRLKEGSAPQGMEMWVREGQAQKSKPKQGFLVPTRCWVDHRKRVVQFDNVPVANGRARGKGKKPEADDHLDMEYRYWSFIEAHPAHTALSANAKVEAMDVLTWAWTDRLLPSQRTVPAPFTQEECQELMSLLRSFSNEPNDAGLQAVVQTRIISRILLRVAHWRQLHFRPNKPLPRDVNSNDLHFPKHRKPLSRALFDLVLSCVCLGIPYIFFERHQHQRLDEESGLRNSTPMFVIGACTCLIAAILLSASVTFLSLPGLDNIARVAGFVAILFSSFSMASTVVAIFKYKADLERPAHLGGEGLVMLSRRNIIMSLPLVFLTYAIIGFVTGIVLYSFRGVTLTDPFGQERPFEDYTKWTVVGVLGGLAGMLTTSLFLLRR